MHVPAVPDTTFFNLLGPQVSHALLSSAVEHVRHEESQSVRGSSRYWQRYVAIGTCLTIPGNGFATTTKSLLRILIQVEHAAR